MSSLLCSSMRSVTTVQKLRGSIHKHWRPVVLFLSRITINRWPSRHLDLRPLHTHSDSRQWQIRCVKVVSVCSHASACFFVEYKCFPLNDNNISIVYTSVAPNLQFISGARATLCWHFGMCQRRDGHGLGPSMGWVSWVGLDRLNHVNFISVIVVAVSVAV